MLKRISYLAPVLLLAAVAACGSKETGTSGSSSSSGSGAGGSTGEGAGSTTGTGGMGAGTGGAGTGGMGTGGAGTGGMGAGTGGGGSSVVGPATQVSGTYFPAGSPWSKDVSKLPLAPDSSAITAWMKSFAPPHGWGTGTMRVDFSIIAVDVPAGTMKRTYAQADGYYYAPDCDLAPAPVPKGGAVEGNMGPLTGFAGYDCPGFADGADCHMLFLSRSENRLYEFYHGTIDAGNNFTAGCLALWDTSKVYGPEGRGQQCTSADAAGFPIAPLLFTPEEIKAGVINHAIRFILPNSMIRAKKYVSPGTHGTNTTGPATSLPYAGRMRLRANYPIQNLSPAAQVVAKALQKYGMLLADGGNIALTAQSDVMSSVKWADVGFDSHSLDALESTDFEVPDYGTVYDVTYDCQRTQILQ
jgi:serine/threonine-protein kinase